MKKSTAFLVCLSAAAVGGLVAAKIYNAKKFAEPEEDFDEDIFEDDPLVVGDDGMLLADGDGDGTIDTVMIDTDGDGTIDTILMDTDGNGDFDTVLADTTGDGKFDSVISEMGK